MIKDLIIQENLGLGAFGTVFKVLKKSDNKITYITESTPDRIAKSRRDLLFSLITLVMIIASALIPSLRPRHDLEIRNIDVGQGDCALISGKGLPDILIDGGSSDIKQVAKNRITPVLKANRISTLDWCFLTHMDSDHVSGVLRYLMSVCRLKMITETTGGWKLPPTNAAHVFL